MELSEFGEQQLVNCLVNLKFERLITSPLNRCFVFAQKVAKQRSIEIEVEKNIKEMDFGDWDGFSYESLWQQTPSIGDFWQNPLQITPPNGESLVDFQTRVNQWWQNLILEDKGDILVLTHGGVIKQIIFNVLGDHDYSALTGKVKVDYAGIVKIEVKLDDYGNVWPMLKF